MLISELPSSQSSREGALLTFVVRLAKLLKEALLKQPFPRYSASRGKFINNFTLKDYTYIT